MPHSKGLAQYWRKMPQWYRLEGVVCETCNTAYFPSRSICPKCRRTGKISAKKFSGTGKVYSFTTIHTTPSGFDLQKPYNLAIIELDEGPRLTAQVVDCAPDNMKIGQKVEAIFRRIKETGPEGIIQYGYKFRPVN